ADPGREREGPHRDSGQRQEQARDHPGEVDRQGSGDGARASARAAARSRRGRRGPGRHAQVRQPARRGPALAMNKADIIDHSATSAEVSKSAAERAVDALGGAVKTSLKKGDMVTLVGFGTFYVGKRQARTGRNPRTGETLNIAASRVPKFRAGKSLKDAIN